VRLDNALLISIIVVSSGCVRSRVPVPPPDVDDARAARMEELRTTIHALVDAGGWNPGRVDAVWRRLEATGLAERPHREGIDWFSVLPNLVVDLPGASPDLHYVVAHYDKIDANPFAVVSLLVNGLPDPLVSWSYLSEGAIDNATGVAVALAFAREMASKPRAKSWRIVLVGAEESGLRGSRSHVAQMSDVDWARLKVAINLDSVGVSFSPNCVTGNVGDARWAGRFRDVATANAIPLGTGLMPLGAASDYAPFERTGFFEDLGRGVLFNLAAGLLPQRSWFTPPRSAPTVNLSACELLDLGTCLANLTLIPAGRLHGAGDRADQVSPVRLEEMLRLLLAVAESIERE